MDRKAHWDNIYNTRELKELSWYEPNPETSLYFLEEYKLPKSAGIIDLGGGDSFFVDHLLHLGYHKLTVVDLSAAALERAKTRLGPKAAPVNWITADIADFTPSREFDFWHDRAAFHFLTKEEEIENYLNTASRFVKKGGILVLGTFSQNGPKKCSGLEIRQYSPSSLTSLLEQHDFRRLECFNVDHATPFGTTQNFTFCSFRNRR